MSNDIGSKTPLKEITANEHLRFDRWFTFFWSALTIVLVCAGMAYWEIRHAVDSLRATTLTEARAAVTTLDPDALAKLVESQSSSETAESAELRRSLIRIQQIAPRYRRLYLLAKKGDAPPALLMDTTEQGRLSAPPATLPPELDASLVATVFATRTETLGPLRDDSSGTWVLVLMPLKNPASGSLTTVVGLQADAAHWRTEIMHRAATPPAVAFVALALLFAFGLLTNYRGSRRTRVLLASSVRESRALIDRLREEVEARRSAEEAVRASRKLLEDILHASSEVAIVATDPTGLITLFNRGAERMLGYSHEELVGKQTPVILHLDSEMRERAAELPAESGTAPDGFRVLITDPTPQESTTRRWTFVRKDGSHVPVSLIRTVMRDEAGEVLGYLGIATDITNVLTSEEAHRETERRFRAIMEQSPFSIMIFSPKGIAVQVNDAHAALWGIPPEVSLGFDIFRDAQLAELGLMPEIHRAFRGERVHLPDVDYDLSATLGVGKHITVQGDFYPIRDQEGALQYVILVHQDITEQKRAQRALADSERLFRAVFDNAPYSITLNDPDTGQYLDVNKAFLDSAGLAREEALQPIAPVRAIDSEAMEEVKDELLRTGIVRNQPTRVRNHNGDMVDLIFSSIILNMQDRRLALSMTVDITEMKKAETALRESEQSFRSIVDSSPMGIHLYELQPDGRLVFIGANPAADAILRVDNSLFVGKTIEEAFPELAGTEVPARYREVAATGQPWSTDRVIYGAGGIEGAFRVFAFQTVPGRMVAQFLDTTEQARAEQALRDSENRLHTLLENLPAAVFIHDGMHCLYINPAMEALTERHRSEIMLREFWEIVHPDFQDIVRKRGTERIKGTGAPARYEMKVLTSSGKELWVDMMATTQVYDGRLCVLGTFTDITERKKAEERVRQSERRYAQAIAATSDAIWEWDLTTDKTYYSPRWYQMLGYDPGEFEMTAETWKATCHPDDLQAALDRIHESLADPEEHSYQAEFRMRTKDGDWRWILGRGNVVSRDQNGAPLILSGTNTDISDRKRAEELLRQAHDELERRVEERTAALAISEARFRTLFTACRDAIMVLDRGVFVDCNGATLELFACHSPNDILGKSPADLSPPSQPGGGNSTLLAQGYLDTAFRDGQSYFEWVHRKADGTDFHSEILLSPMVLEGRQVIQAVVRDITARKKSERDIEQASARLAAANKELEAFSYSVSHDLRAPLRAIDGFSLALLEDYGDSMAGEARDYLNRVRAASQRMGRLIDDMLVLSRVTRTQPRITLVNLSTLATQVIDELRAGEPDRHVECHIQHGVTARCDPSMLSAVLSNLLGNAWKFTSKRTNPEISFGVEEIDEKQVYFVRDNGAGFDMAYAQKLFGVFQRLHSAEEFPGTGVGLATVQRIINRHDGQIWAESKVGEGATFYFTLGQL